MNRYMELLDSKKMTLIMSLPANDPVLCRAAFEEGADVVKVHINVEHRASGTHFGRLSDERSAFEEMLTHAKGPMGLVPGASLETAVLDLEEAASMGFDFFSVYAHHMPVGYSFNGQLWMAACDGSYSLDEIAAMQHCGADVLEASIMPGAEYGQPLSLRDLLRYQAIVSHTKLPVVVPTQRFIRPEEIPALSSAGIHGLMIGAVVTGRTVDGIRRSVSAFRNAIDRM